MSNYVSTRANEIIYGLIKNDEFIVNCYSDTADYKIVIFDLKGKNIILNNNSIYIKSTVIDIKSRIRNTRCGRGVSDSLDILQISSNSGIVYDKISKLYIYINSKR